MTLLIAPIIFIAVIVYVALPLLADAQEAAQEEQQMTTRESVLKRKEDVIGSLKDIEMDFRMGKLSPEDYQALKSEFEERAIAVLHEEDTLETEDGKNSQSKKK